MNTTHTAPSGFSFTMREPADVPERLRRPVAKALVKLTTAFEPASDGTSPQVGEEDKPRVIERDMTDDDLDLADSLNDLLAVALIVEWSAPAPVSVDALLDLPSADYAAVREAAAPHVLSMLPDYSPSPDAESPSKP